MTRSPIELLWTAKNGLRGQNNLSNYDCLLITLIFFSNPVRVGQSKLIASECYGRGRCMELRQFCQHGQQHHPPSQLSLIISNFYQLWPTNINITFSCFSDCSHIMSAVRGGGFFNTFRLGYKIEIQGTCAKIKGWNSPTVPTKYHFGWGIFICLEWVCGENVMKLKSWGKAIVLLNHCWSFQDGNVNTWKWRDDDTILGFGYYVNKRCCYINSTTGKVYDLDCY